MRKIEDLQYNRAEWRKRVHDARQGNGKTIKALARTLRALKARKNRKNNEKAQKAKGLFYV